MSYNILIVDDSSLTRVAIRRIIEMVDIDAEDIFEACNGVEALGILSGNDIDLVLADLNMPNMNGVEMVDLVDEQIGKAEGHIALQIHDGGGIKVRWRNLRVVVR